ncbi:pentatricopeptide repeat-containing protein At1g52640, mitochondrial [Phoenix dactylifera]|uniref:Pentatricopeptide repeat-containing protein At1g52640, mitochondrial n=1 Tax=Phoenix dactylifera TaxID=42345 RepID=A0A8B7CT49_PHODC|nr:pentatricopeptide repeat-containing protein At1g52640, mitochondrial [Phoenix dactylifera]
MLVSRARTRLLVSFASRHLLSSQPDPHPSPTSPSSFSAAVSASDVVNDLCRVLSDFRAPHHDLDAALRPFAPLLTPALAEHVLKRCSRLPGAAHRFFLWSDALPGFRHTPASCLVVIESLAASRHFPLLWSFLSELRDSGLSRGDADEIRPEAFWLLFRSYSRARLPADAVRSFKRMPDFGLQPVLEDLHQLLFSLCRNGLVEQAHSFFDQSKLRFPVNQKTYSMVMGGWAAAGNSKKALELFDEMLQRGCLADAVAYNTLIMALCRGGEIDEAHRRLQEMQRDRGLKPDAGTYSAFIRASCEAKDVHSAMRVLDTMKRHDLSPNVFTYNAIIKLLCEKENVVEAYELLDEMLHRGAKPDAWSYNAILAVHCKLHEVNKALRLLARMVRDSCLPDRHTYNMLLKMLIGVGRIDRAMEVWDGMEKRGFYPSASTFAVMIHGLCRKKGRIEEACQYFEVMVDEGIPPYLSTCELLRDKLLQLGLRERVGVLVEKMKMSTSCTIQELSSAMGKEKG